MTFETSSRRTPALVTLGEERHVPETLVDCASSRRPREHHDAGADARSYGGTWKLNAAKSKTPYKSGQTVIESAGDGIKATVDLVGGDGTAYHWTWTAKYDGKDNPVTGTTAYGTGGMVALTRVNPRTLRIVAKFSGKATLTQTMVVSADGKMRTVDTKGMDAKGQPIDTMSVYEKQ